MPGRAAVLDRLRRPRSRGGRPGLDHRRRGRLSARSASPGTSPRPRANRLPVSGIPLGGGIGAALEQAAAALAGAPSGAEVLAALRAAYRPEATFNAAFGGWLHRLLAGTGIVTIDPADARLKRLGAPLFAREIAEPGIVGRAVAEQTARLTAAGYAAQIDVREGMLTLFLHEPGRIAIETTDRGLRLSGGRRLDSGELEGILSRAPERFSPNAALRPLFQDTLLPTVAMVLGPAELAYCAQLGSPTSASTCRCPCSSPAHRSPCSSRAWSVS